MPAPTKQPLRVAECAGCGQLFAVYETAGEVACPGCSATTSVESLEVAELQVASSVEVEVPAPQLAEPEPADHREEAPQQTAPEEAAQPERPPTVAEWLVRSEDQQQTTPETQPAAADLAPKPSLAESLGWQPGSFQLDRAEQPATESAPEPEPETPSERPLAAASDFRFDFDSTPLSGSSNAGAEEESLNGPAAPERLNLMASDAPTGDDAPRPATDDWTGSADEPKRSGWFGPLTAAAGLLAVLGPLGYLGWSFMNDPTLVALEQPLEAGLDESPVSTDAASDEEMPPEPWEPATLAPETTADAEPIVDPETKPASFDASGFDEPTPPATQPEPETASAAPNANATPVDPFNALPETPAPADEEAQPAYETPKDDRYASTTAEEPTAEADLASFDETVSIPLEAPAETPPPFEPQAVGLVNAPSYGVADLAAALRPAAEASRGFAAGTLTDPEQVQSMGQHYARLCHLAQVLTLFDPDPSDPSRMTTELEAADLFQRLFIEAGPREESRQIAGPWIDWTGRPHGGVFFAGVPDEIRQAGKVVQYRFPLGDKHVTVLMAEPLDRKRFTFSGAREVGVIGVVVENPREWIAGYEGDAERVVWVRKTLPLREPIEL